MTHPDPVPDHPRRAARLRPRAPQRQGGDPREPAGPAARGRGRRSPASSASTTPCCPSSRRALLAGHDLVLLGERGQGKTRLMRTLGGLLDEWTPGRRGLRDQRRPVRAGRACAAAGSRRARRRPAGRVAAPQRALRREARDPGHRASATSSATSTRSRSRRAARSATPRRCTTASSRAPTAASSALNELPDLAERIQVALFNVLEERDIQVRGYSLRLPLDLLLVATANPEDYTNRGRIITPLKDRFGAEVRTHYPLEVDRRGRPDRARRPTLVADVPDHLLEVVARFTRRLRESPAVDQRSGVSARFAIAAAETVAASALRRAARHRRGRRRRPRLRPARRSCPRCSARSSSRSARRAASATCSPTCCACRRRDLPLAKNFHWPRQGEV